MQRESQILEHALYVVWTNHDNGNMIHLAATNFLMKFDANGTYFR